MQPRRNAEDTLHPSRARAKMAGTFNKPTHEKGSRPCLNGKLQRQIHVSYGYFCEAALMIFGLSTGLDTVITLP